MKPISKSRSTDLARSVMIMKNNLTNRGESHIFCIYIKHEYYYIRDRNISLHDNIIPIYIDLNGVDTIFDISNVIYRTINKDKKFTDNI
ncbi:MAG: hypothetical protein ACRCX2_29975 [Paraclostridium sp.]